MLKGSLFVSQKLDQKSEEEEGMYIVHTDELVGALAVISGEPSLFTVRVHKRAQVAILSKNKFYE